MSAPPLFPFALSLLPPSSAGGGSGPATPDPDMTGVLDAFKRLDPKPIESLSPQEARQQPSPADAVKAFLEQNGRPATPEPVASVENRTIPGPAGEIALRVYTPSSAARPATGIVYFHGGGFVIADLDVYDSSPRALANATGAIVVSAHYRQAPEHTFPAAHEDAFAAYRWVCEHARDLGIDPRRIAVAGESAGGNLAAGVCLMARSAHVPLPLHQLLVYPVTDNDLDTPSYRENAEAKPLNKAMMAWFFKHAADPSATSDPRLALLKKADLAGLPPATVITAQIDPLRSEGEAFARKLRAAGVPVSFRNFDGVTHEFFGMGAAVAKAKEAVQYAAGDLKRTIDRTSAPVAA